MDGGRPHRNVILSEAKDLPPGAMRSTFPLYWKVVASLLRMTVGGACRLLPALCLLAASACSQAGNAPQTAPPTLVLLGENGEHLFTCPAPEGFAFGIRFTHSVALSPVEDWFSVRDGVIHLDKTVYQDFGAGLPHEPEPGQTMTAENGRIVISGYDRPLPSFTVRVGRIANHSLLPPPSCGAGAEIFLKSLAPAGSPVTFTLIPEQGSQRQ